MSTTIWCGLILPSVPPASLASTTTTSVYSQPRLDAHTTNQRNQQTHHAWWCTAPCVVGVWSWICFIFDVNGICELSTDGGNCCSQTVGTKCDAGGLDFGYGTRAGGRGRQQCWWDSFVCQAQLWFSLAIVLRWYYYTVTGGVKVRGHEPNYLVFTAEAFSLILLKEACSLTFVDQLSFVTSAQIGRCYIDDAVTCSAWRAMTYMKGQ